MHTLHLSDDQKQAVATFKKWLKTDSREFRLGGLAGTGKTTIVQVLLSLLDDCEVFAPTARAAQVLRSKGVNAETLHSLLLRFRYETTDKTGRLVPVFTDKHVHRGFILVDESSMVSEELYQKAMRCADRIIWVGDYGQLPPVEESTNGFCVMTESTLDAKLITQHRHSDNANLIDFANHLRDGLDPSGFTGGDSVVVNPPGIDGRNMVQFLIEQNLTPIICYTNEFRAHINRAMRYARGLPASGLCVGLEITCSKNNYRKGVFNGELMEIVSVIGDQVRTKCGKSFPATFDRNESDKDKVVIEDGFGITCHKAQGSEFSKVCVVEDRSACPQWRYTAATRAKELLVYFKKA